MDYLGLSKQRVNQYTLSGSGIYFIFGAGIQKLLRTRFFNFHPR